MLIEAVFERGVFRPLEAVTLPEDQVAWILLPDLPQIRPELSRQEKVSARTQLMALAGVVNSSDPDAANNERIDADLAHKYDARRGGER
jgi:predicted DNA-binding antitoxin AbrB/MazE fold protein